MFSERSYEKIIDVMKPQHSKCQKRKKDTIKFNDLQHLILNELNTHWKLLKPISKKIIGESNLCKRFNAVLKILESCKIIEMKNGYARLRPNSSGFSFNVASVNEMNLQLVQENALLENTIKDLLHEYAIKFDLNPNTQIVFEQCASQLFLQNLSPFTCNTTLSNWLFLWKHAIPSDLTTRNCETFNPFQPPVTVK